MNAIIINFILVNLLEKNALMYKEPTLEEIKQGNNSSFSKMYEEYKAPFMAFTYKYGISEEDAIEIYQESIIALFENAVSGKLTELTSSVKTYVFSIGKYKVMEHLRASKKTTSLESFHLHDDYETIEIKETILTEKQKLLKLNFSKLGARCQNILEQFYLFGKTIAEIKAFENYENENTVKAQKSRCLKQLKQLITPH